VKPTDRKKAVRAWQAERAAAAKAGGVVRHQHWFFVVHLSAVRRGTSEAPYEVQLLDEDGRAIEVARFAGPESSVDLRGVAVPSAVLQSAAELPEGQGCYVDEAGWEVTALGHRVAAEVARATGGRKQNRA